MRPFICVKDALPDGHNTALKMFCVHGTVSPGKNLTEQGCDLVLQHSNPSRGQAGLLQLLLQLPVGHTLLTASLSIQMSHLKVHQMSCASGLCQVTSNARYKGILHPALLS